MIIKNITELQQWIAQIGIEHFKADEFVCPCCGKVIIDTNLILKLEDLRSQYGKPIIITSAYRCPKHNKAVGGVPNSEHTQGKAVDIKCDNSKDRFSLLDIIFKYSLFNRIGIGAIFLHLGIAEDKPQNVVWTYYNKE